MSGTGWKFTSAPTGVTLDTLNTSTLAPVNFDVNGAVITLNPSSKAVVTNNVEIQGNLTVNGLTTQVDSTTVTVSDPLLKLAKDNSANTLDIGFYGKYVSAGDKYTGLFYDSSDSKFKIFTGLAVEPTTTVDTTAPSYTPATLVASIEGTVNSIANFTTDDLTQGTTNLYYSDTLAQGAFTAGTGIDITGGVISITGGGLSQWTTVGSDIYYNTGNVGIMTGTATPSYKLDVDGDINFTGLLRKSGTQVNTDDIPEGLTNLYYSDTLARAALSAGTGISYNSGSGEISLNVASSTVSALNAYATSYVSSGSATDTIQFASGDITLDNSTAWSLVNHNYVIPTTGNYRIKFSFTGAIYTPDVSLALVINGTPSTTIKASDYISGGNIRSTASNEIIRAMTAADTLGIKLIVDRVTYPTSTITLENVSLVINYIPSSTFSSFSGGDVTVTNITSSGYIQSSVNRMTVAVVDTTKYANLHLTGDPDTVSLINLANLSSNDGRRVKVIHCHATGTLTINIRDSTDTTTIDTIALSAREDREFIFYSGRWY